MQTRINWARRSSPLGLACLAALLLVRSGAADAPDGQYTVDEDVVLDTATKLSWQRTLAEDSYSFEDAEHYCAKLALAGGGWRLPSIKELHTLVDETRTQPAIDTTAFAATPPAFFWSSSHTAGLTQYVWSVSFSEGIDGWFATEMTLRVRCVR